MFGLKMYGQSTRKSLTDVLYIIYYYYGDYYILSCARAATADAGVWNFDDKQLALAHSVWADPVDNAAATPYLREKLYLIKIPWVVVA